RWLLTAEARTAPPVVVVTGAGGIGKTALAVQLAHLLLGHYPDGQLYVELRGTNTHPAEPAEVLAQLIRAFGVENLPPAGEERVKLFRSLVAERKVLLVLDDARDETHV